MLKQTYIHYHIECRFENCSNLQKIAILLVYRVDYSWIHENLKTEKWKSQNLQKEAVISIAVDCRGDYRGLTPANMKTDIIYQKQKQ